MVFQLMINGTWGTCASLCFFLGALFGGDLLALRGALLSAYIFAFINGVTGMPPWPLTHIAGRLGIEAMTWALLTGSLHACAVIRMIRDELPVRFTTEDDAQLAAFFNRRSGMEPLEAQEVLKRGRWVHVPAGQRIVSSAQLHENLYLLVEGVGSYSNGLCPATSTAQSISSSTDLCSPMERVVHWQQTAAPHIGCSSVSSHAYCPGEEDPLALSRTITLTDALPGEDNQHDQSSRPQSLTAIHEQAEQLRYPSGCKAAQQQQLPGLSNSVHNSDTSLTEPLLPHADGTKTGVTAGTAPLVKHSAFAVAAQQVGSNEQQQQQHQQLCPRHGHTPAPSRLMRSGHVFSLSALNVFGVYIGFDQSHHRQLEVIAETDCLLFSWSMEGLEEMANKCSPALASYWRNFIIYTIASEFELRAHRGSTAPRCSTGEFEPSSWLQGGRSRDFTDPPRDYEHTPRFGGARVARWLKKALNPLQPPGMRHTALPVTGVMARTRALAMAEAKMGAAVAAGRNTHSMA